MLTSLICLLAIGQFEKPADDPKLELVRLLPEIAPKGWKIHPNPYVKILPRIGDEFYAVATDDEPGATVFITWGAFDLLVMSELGFDKSRRDRELAKCIERGDIVELDQNYKVRLIGFYSGAAEFAEVRKFCNWVEKYPAYLEWQRGQACEVEFLAGPLKGKTAIMAHGALNVMIPPEEYPRAKEQWSKFQAELAKLELQQQEEAVNAAAAKSKAEAAERLKEQRLDELRRTLEKQRARRAQQKGGTSKKKRGS